MPRPGVACRSWFESIGCFLHSSLLLKNSPVGPNGLLLPISASVSLLLYSLLFSLDANTPHNERHAGFFYPRLCTLALQIFSSLHFSSFFFSLLYITHYSPLLKTTTPFTQESNKKKKLSGLFLFFIFINKKIIIHLNGGNVTPIENRSWSIS